MKLRAAFPKGELNGLSEVHNDAVTHVGKTYLVVAQVRVIETITDYEKARDAKYGIERIEVVDVEDQATIAEMIEQQFASRTGKAVLDLDMPDVVDLRKVYAEKRARRSPTLKREPGEDTVPVVVDPAALAPDEVGEEADPEQPEEAAEGVPAEPVDDVDEAAAEGAEADAERADDGTAWVGAAGALSEEEQYQEEEPGVPFDVWLEQQKAAQAASGAQGSASAAFSG